MISNGGRRAARAIVRGPFTAQTWLATMHVLTSLPITAITFSVMASLAAVGVVVAPTVVLVAVPLVAMMASAEVFTAWQRSRFAFFLGVSIPLPASRGLPRPDSLRADLVAAIRTRSTWRQIGYHMLVAPAIAWAGSAAVALSWSGAIVAFIVPGPAGRWALTVTRTAWLAGPDGSAEARVVSITGAVAGGLVLLFLAPWVARGFAWLDAAAATKMLGLSRAEELARHVTSLAESRAGVVSAADTERRRIERDLHDGAQQRLVAMAMHLGLARSTLTGVSGEAMAVIERAHEDAKEALHDLRDLVQGLHPAILNDRGLDAALSGLAARAPIPVRLTVSVPGKLPSAVEAVAFFVVSEALTNAAKHAAATEAEVTVTHDGAALRVAIGDDGHGGADPAGGSGLRGLAQRAASVDGSLRIQSPEGGPTVITAELPCGS